MSITTTGIGQVPLHYSNTRGLPTDERFEFNPPYIKVFSFVVNNRNIIAQNFQLWEMEKDSNMAIYRQSPYDKRILGRVKATSLVTHHVEREIAARTEQLKQDREYLQQCTTSQKADKDLEIAKTNARIAEENIKFRDDLIKTLGLLAAIALVIAGIVAIQFSICPSFFP